MRVVVQYTSCIGPWNTWRLRYCVFLYAAISGYVKVSQDADDPKPWTSDRQSRNKARSDAESILCACACARGREKERDKGTWYRVSTGNLTGFLVFPIVTWCNSPTRTSTVCLAKNRSPPASMYITCWKRATQALFVIFVSFCRFKWYWYAFKGPLKSESRLMCWWYVLSTQNWIRCTVLMLG